MAPFGPLLSFLSDLSKVPILEMGTEASGPFEIEEPHPILFSGNSTLDYVYIAYRLKVHNKQKYFLNSAAESCVAWLDLERTPEAYQLAWVGSQAEMTINVGDYREIDLCARVARNGSIVAPTERGYWGTEERRSSPRTIGNGIDELRGEIRVTSANGKLVSRRIIISPTNDRHLTVDIH